MPSATTVGGLVATVLAAADLILGRWLAHVTARVTELRERVARLEGGQNREDR